MSREKYSEVFCFNEKGLVQLTHSQYLAQLSRPNALWHCPNCGSEARFAHHWYPCLDESCSGYYDDESGDGVCTACNRHWEDIAFPEAPATAPDGTDSEE